jgi:eukaryotic-like serine/threonine-protein kinase
MHSPAGKWKIACLMLAWIFVLAACSPGRPVTVKSVTTAPTLAQASTRLPTKVLTIPVSTPPPASSPTITPTPGLGSTRFSFKDGMIQVYVPGGEFTMGSTDYDIWLILSACRDCRREQFTDETPSILVNLDGFWIDSTEVTTEMFATFVNSTGYQTEAEKASFGYGVNVQSLQTIQIKDANWRQPGGGESILGKLTDHPVSQVTWNDAKAYCEWAGRKLPTEAQWEKAARGTQRSLFPWGDQMPNGTLLNMADASLGQAVRDRTINDSFANTSPVGSFPAGISPYGAMDMSGNVSEWVSDLYSNTTYTLGNLHNPTGAATGSDRVVRGGGWNSALRFVLSAYRSYQKPSYRASFIGFRCASNP